MELRQLLEILWRRRRLFLGLAAGVFLGFMLISVLVVPRYVATSKVMLYKSPSATTLLTTLGLRSSMLTETVSDAEVANYKQVALSAPVMQAVAEQLQPQRLRFRSILPRMIPGATWLFPKLGLEGLLNATKPVQWDEMTNKSFLQFFIPRPYVDIDEDQDADLYTITVQTTDMADSVRLANAWADAFIARDAELQREEFYRFGDSIEARLPLAKAEYERTLKELQEFREKNTSLSLEEEVVRLIAQISNVAAERDEASVETERSRAMLAESQRLLANTPKYSKSQEQLARNPVIDSVKLTLRDLYLELANTKTLFTDKHPVVVDIQARIAQARDIIKEEAGKVYNGETLSQDPLYLELSQVAAQRAADVAGYEMQQQAYDQVLAKLQTKLLKLPALQSKYALLMLAANRAQEYFQTLTDIRYQVETARTMTISNLRLVEAASIPPDITDYKQPNLMLFTALAVFLAGFFSLTGTFLREYLDPTVLRPDDAEAAAKAPCLAVLPALPARHAPSPFAAEHPWRQPLVRLAATLEACPEEARPDRSGRMARRADAAPVSASAGASGVAAAGASALLQAPSSGSKRCALLPMHDEAAAALATVLLGSLFAREQHAVLFLDFCAPRSRLEACFTTSTARSGPARAPALADFLAGKAALADCLLPTPLERAALLPIDLHPAQSHALPKHALAGVLAELAGRFDRPLGLLPALKDTADGLRMASLMEDVILVASQGRTTKDALADAARDLTLAGSAVRGVILLQEQASLPFPWPCRSRPNAV
ncbi:exopolysaccharide transport family protein [Megalodesulfovibrio paquesii]